MTAARIISAALAAWRDCAEYVVVDHEWEPVDLAREIRLAWIDRDGRNIQIDPVVYGGTVTVTLYDRRVKMGAVIIAGRNKTTKESPG